MLNAATIACICTFSFFPDSYLNKLNSHIEFCWCLSNRDTVTKPAKPCLKAFITGFFYLNFFRINDKIYLVVAVTHFGGTSMEAMEPLGWDPWSVGSEDAPGMVS